MRARLGLEKRKRFIDRTGKSKLFDISWGNGRIMAAFVGRLLATIAGIFQRDTREKRDALFRRAAKVTNFDALMNAGLNVPGSLTRLGSARKAKEKRRLPQPVGYSWLKKNYTGNHPCSPDNCN